VNKKESEESEEQMIAITCPHCGYTGEVPESMLGQDVACPNCGEVFKIQ